MEGLIDKNRFHEQKIVNKNNCDKTLERTFRGTASQTVKSRDSIKELNRQNSKKTMMSRQVKF
jgi:hypothetical protein